MLELYQVKTLYCIHPFCLLSHVLGFLLSSSCDSIGFLLCYNATPFLPVNFRCLLTGLILLVWLIVYQSVSVFVFVFTVCAITVALGLRDRKTNITLNWEMNKKTYTTEKT